MREMKLKAQQILVIFLAAFVFCMPAMAQKSHVKRHFHAKSIYSRYTKKRHRYLIAKDAAPAKKQALKAVHPVKEHLSRYGNPLAYNVKGHHYEVLQSAIGYKSRGIASWYGTKFQKQRTSSGEPYNMYVMTAAHKTLPLPTYLKVKNLDNGKVAVVKVNDRGPFHSNRLIDLSYAAALKLGVYPKGTAHVEIETLMGPTEKGHYYLQAGAFSSASLAKRLQKKVLGLSKTSPVFVAHDKQHYLVRVGPFATRGMADNVKKTLSHHGVNGVFSLLI
jgi:rare lipoprotein A